MFASYYSAFATARALEFRVLACYNFITGCACFHVFHQVLNKQLTNYFLRSNLYKGSLKPQKIGKEIASN